MGAGVAFDLRAAVSSAAGLQPLKVSEKVEQQVGERVGGSKVQFALQEV